MKKYHLSCPIRKANPHKKAVKTKKSHFAPNILNRNFDPGILGQVLLTDITYVYYANGKCAYLSTIRDGCTKQIAAYHLRQNMTVDIVTDTIHILKNNELYQVEENAIFHSDQGTQYTSESVKKLLEKEKFIPLPN